MKKSQIIIKMIYCTTVSILDCWPTQESQIIRNFICTLCQYLQSDAQNYQENKRCVQQRQMYSTLCGNSNLQTPNIDSSMMDSQFNWMRQFLSNILLHNIGWQVMKLFTKMILVGREKYSSTLINVWIKLKI